MATNSVHGKLIGMMVDPHPSILVGIFGILKSGHGFVPFDPKIPVER